MTPICVLCFAKVFGPVRPGCGRDPASLMLGGFCFTPERAPQICRQLRKRWTISSGSSLKTFLYGPKCEKETEKAAVTYTSGKRSWVQSGKMRPLLFRSSRDDADSRFQHISLAGSRATTAPWRVDDPTEGQAPLTESPSSSPVVGLWERLLREIRIFRGLQHVIHAFGSQLSAHDSGAEVIGLGFSGAPFCLDFPEQVQGRELSQRVHVLSKAACGFCDSPPLVPGPIPHSPPKAGALESEGPAASRRRTLGLLSRAW